MINSQVFENMINSPRRSFRGRVELYNGSTLTQVCGCHDRLIEFTVERIGEHSKFFGFGICQKLTVKLLDKDRTLNITKDHSLEVEFGVEKQYIYPCPKFFVEDVTRDENTNTITVTGYDALYAAAAHTVAELEITNRYSIKEFAIACGSFLGLPVKGVELDSFNLYFDNGANFNGTETIREALNAIADATQTIYYINSDWELTFKRLDVTSVPVAIIDKSKYMTLTTSEMKMLTGVMHATELGDNVSNEMGVDGVTQYIRNNPFWELREDIAELVDAALAAVGGTHINGFACTWRGNFLIEIGDSIAFITKDDGIITSYLLDDTYTFNGGLSAITQWSYNNNQEKSTGNPTTLGEVLKQTSAKVDKVTQEIELVVQQAQNNTDAITTLTLNTNGIYGSVGSLESKINENTKEVEELQKAVAATMTDEEIEIAINTRFESGVNKVQTTTGFTFNEQGLTVSKSDSDISTTITEDGMSVNKGSAEVLTANNEGVKAIDLHATTYLIIGKNSRFEDYGNRTGCYWIGG